MGGYRYPHPLELARKRAETHPTRAAWGSLGGLSTYYRCGGSSWFRLLALRRWGRIPAADLEAARVLR